MGWTRPGRGWEEALTVDRDLLHPAPTAPPWAKKAFRTIGMSQVTEFLLYPPPPQPPPPPPDNVGVSAIGRRHSLFSVKINSCYQCEKQS